MYIYIYISTILEIAFGFLMLTTCTQKILGTGTTNFVRVSDLCSEVCLLFMTVENEKKHIYIYMMFMRFVKLKFAGEDV